MPSAVPLRAPLRALAAAATALAIGAPAAEAVDPVAATVDRTTGVTDPPPAMERAQDRLRNDLGARALVQPDETAGTPRIVARLDGFLTPPVAARSGGDRARLRPRTTPPRSGWTPPISRRSGSPPARPARAAACISCGSSGSTACPTSTAACRRPSAATAGCSTSAAARCRIRRRPPRPRRSAPPRHSSPPFRVEPPLRRPGPRRGAEQRTPFLGGGEASLVLYRDRGADRLAWRVLYAASSDAFYDAIVDARTGVLQRRVNRTHSVEEINHFDVSPRAAGDSATSSPIPGGWLGAGERRLKGPYVHAVSDLDDSIWLAEDPGGYHLSQSPDAADEVEPSTPVGAGPRLDRRARAGPELGLLHLVLVGRLAGQHHREPQVQHRAAVLVRQHVPRPPRRRRRSASPARARFEGDDAVIAQTLDGASPTPGALPDSDHTSNANMTVLPDGFPGLHADVPLRPDQRRSLRRGDGRGHRLPRVRARAQRTARHRRAGLRSAQRTAARCDREGTSDFYAMDYLVATEPAAMDDDPARQGDVRLGRWMHSNSSPTLKALNTIRTESMDCFPQPVDSTRCGGPTPASAAGTGGYTYDDFGKIDGAPEVHADGEIWAQTLWSLRKALIDARGTSEGLSRVRAYVTDGLRLSPAYPTFLDMRNAIVQAAVNLHGQEDWDTIWSVFGARGMGWSADTTARRRHHGGLRRPAGRPDRRPVRYRADVGDRRRCGRRARRRHGLPLRVRRDDAARRADGSRTGRRAPAPSPSRRRWEGCGRVRRTTIASRRFEARTAFPVRSGASPRRGRRRRRRRPRRRPRRRRRRRPSRSSRRRSRTAS